MILALSLVIGGLILMIAVLVAIFREQGRSIGDLMDANRRLSEDNRRLTESICGANGVTVNLRDVDEPLPPRRAPLPPYFSSKPVNIPLIVDKQANSG